MAILYKIQIHPYVSTEDLPRLPEQLLLDFAMYRLVLARNPQKPPHIPSHNLTGNLSGYRALEVGWEGKNDAYRLVYRVYEKPAPRRVLIVSFAEHDPAERRTCVNLGAVAEAKKRGHNWRQGERGAAVNTDNLRDSTDNSSATRSWLIHNPRWERQGRTLKIP